MDINVSKIKMTPGASAHFQLRETLNPAAYGYAEYQLTEPVSVSGSITNQGDGTFVLHGSYSAVAVLTCSRCGKDFSFTLSGEIDAMFAAEPAPDQEGEYSIFRLEQETADLGEAVAGEIFFALPMQPLCRPDCKGLCPVCGTDLNQNSCSCQGGNIDPRWEKLKNFIIDED